MQADGVKKKWMGHRGWSLQGKPEACFREVHIDTAYHKSGDKSDFTATNSAPNHLVKENKGNHEQASTMIKLYITKRLSAVFEKETLQPNTIDAMT